MAGRVCTEVPHSCTKLFFRNTREIIADSTFLQTRLLRGSAAPSGTCAARPGPRNTRRAAQTSAFSYFLVIQAQEANSVHKAKDKLFCKHKNGKRQHFFATSFLEPPGLDFGRSGAPLGFWSEVGSSGAGIWSDLGGPGGDS